MFSIKKSLKNIPVPILPTMVGVDTLSNVWILEEFSLIRHISVWAGIIILCLYTGKLILYFDVVKSEYLDGKISSLHAGFTMLIMITGGYFVDYFPVFGKTIWFFGIFLHIIHLSLFVYLHIIKNFEANNFVPTWLVTFAGLMTATVAGTSMNEPEVCTAIVWYGLIVPIGIVWPLMVFRLIKNPIRTGSIVMSKAILAAPPSLFLVSYLNIVEEPVHIVIYIVYGIILTVLVYIIFMLSKFLTLGFNPSFASLTFPLAIACLASTKMIDYFYEQGQYFIAQIITEILGIQIYMATSIIGVIAFKFFTLIPNHYKQEKKNA